MPWHCSVTGNPGGIAATRKSRRTLQGGLPHFRKVQKFRSFTLKQAGWKLLESKQKYGRVQIGKKVYKLVYHRPMQGNIKTVTIKRDTAGRLWICFSVVERFVVQKEASTGQSGGFDFGLKTFLTSDEGQQIDMPWFYQDDLPRLRSIQRQVSKKVKGSATNRRGSITSLVVTFGLMTSGATSTSSWRISSAMNTTCCVLKT